MNKLISLVLLTVGVFSATSAQRESQPKQPRYPNEIPTLKLYEDAKWKSLQPYISNERDIERLLGQPVPIVDNRVHDECVYELNSDWIVTIDVVGKGGDLPDSLVGRVFHVRLYPKKRVSLIGADLSAFRAYTFTDSRDPTVGGTVYYDTFGLRYSVYAKDAPDGRFHAGDLELIIYGPSDEETRKYTRSVPATSQ